MLKSDGYDQLNLGFNVLESRFYLATRKEGAAIIDEKLHCNGVLPTDGTLFASCQVGGFMSMSHATDSGKRKGVNFMPNEECDSTASKDRGKASHATLG